MNNALDSPSPHWDQLEEIGVWANQIMSLPGLLSVCVYSNQERESGQVQTNSSSSEPIG